MSVAPAAENRRSLQHSFDFLLHGYVQQVVALGTLLAFNLVLPAVVGLHVFGAFTAAQGLVFLVVGVFGGGLDLLLLRDASRTGGGIQRNSFQKILHVKLAFLLAAALLLVLARPLLLPSGQDYQGVAGWTAALTLFLGLSFFFIAAYTSGRRNDLAVVLTIGHSFAYIGLPLLACFIFGSSASMLLAGLAISYVLMVACEVAWLPRLQWNEGGTTDSAFTLFGRGAMLSSVTIYDVIRFWATFYLGAFALSPDAVGVAKVAFSTGMGFATLVPVPPYSLVVVGEEWQANARLADRLMEFVRPATVLGGLAAAFVCYALGAILYPTQQFALAAAAITVLFVPFAIAVSRLAISVRLGSLSPRAIVGFLSIATIITVTTALVAPRLMGLSGLLLAPIAGSLAAVALLDRALLREMAGRAEITVAVVACALLFALYRAQPDRAVPFALGGLTVISIVYAAVYLRQVRDPGELIGRIRTLLKRGLNNHNAETKHRYDNR
jgi:hypothetical protein